MDLAVSGSLRGTVCAPPSKSHAHRLLIASFLSSLHAGGSTVQNLSYSEDICATLDACKALGANVCVSGSTASFAASTLQQGSLVDCKESGSTLRFMLPICAALGANASFAGQGRLPERPIGVLQDCLTAKGCSFSASALPLTVQGKAQGGYYCIDPAQSSQYLTGLLFSLPLLEQNSIIHLISAVQSKPYVDLTLEALAQFGIEISSAPEGYRIKGGQQYRPCSSTVEGDWSNAAFWLTACALGQQVTVTGLNNASTQGDKKIVDLLTALGLPQQIATDHMHSIGADTSVTIDAAHIPDLVPILAVAATAAHGTTIIRGAKRLRLKESDRLQAIAENLNRLGGNVTQMLDGLIIEGGVPLAGGKVDCFHDHRIAMAFAIAALVCQKPVLLQGAECVQKSYPNFFEEYKQLGGVVDVLDVG